MNEEAGVTDRVSYHCPYHHLKEPLFWYSTYSLLTFIQFTILYFWIIVIVIDRKNYYFGSFVCFFFLKNIVDFNLVYKYSIVWITLVIITILVLNIIVVNFNSFVKTRFLNDFVFVERFKEPAFFFWKREPIVLFYSCFLLFFVFLLRFP